MPIWLSLALAAGVILGGAGVPTYLRAHRTRTGALADGLRTARAHVEATRYLIDTSDPGVDAAEASRLCDTAEATLATARDEMSVDACAQAEELLQQAEAELDRAGNASDGGRTDPS